MKTKYTSKPGTIGRSIEKLVNKCKSNPMQFYVLQAALEKACGVEGGVVVLMHGLGQQTILISATPGYKAAQVELDAILVRCGVAPVGGEKPVSEPAPAPAGWATYS